MLPLTKKYLKRLPGLRSLIAQRNALLAQRQELFAERETLTAERDELQQRAAALSRERQSLRAALADGRLAAEALRPSFPRDRPRLERAAGQFFAVAAELADLDPDDSVLEIGCGMGMLARHFESYLSDIGGYHGIDVDPAAVAVCRDTFSNPTLTFAALDVRNERHNPHGRLNPRQFALPFDDERFDLVAVRTLLTRTYPAVIDRWLAEVARTLRRGGTCVAGAYLMNDEVVARLEAGEKASRSFSYDYGDFRVDDDDDPLVALAVDEGWLRSAADRHGLQVVEPIRYGRWARPDGPYQLDVVGLAKPG